MACRAVPLHLLHRPCMPRLPHGPTLAPTKKIDPTYPDHSQTPPESREMSGST